MNCHSNVTTYPSYTRIQPVGWWTKGHVKAGRKKLNFSEWNSYDPNQKAHHLRECMEVLNEGRMPLKSYTWLHPESKLNKEQTDKLLELFIRLENI